MSTLYAAKVNVTAQKEKKPRTEKQIAAFEKAKETRAKNQELKRLQEEKEMEEKQNELEEANRKLQELEEKKRVANEKRKASREAKRKQQELESVTATSEVEIELSSRKKKPKKEEEAKSETTLVEKEEEKKVDETVPPAWFKKYIEGMAQTQNQLEGTKKAQKVIREEAKNTADEKWAQPSVRQQVTKTMDNHMEKMYAQIFGGRRLTRV